ncbi:MAG: hypothetical protein ACYC2H_11955 [Thermoplasmatota archaeon]
MHEARPAMKRALVFVLFLLLAPEAAASEAHLEFDAPAHFEGAANVTGLEWALLVFRESTETTFEADLTGAGTVVNHTMAVWATPSIGPGPVVEEGSQFAQLPEQPVESGPVSAQAKFAKPWGSLYIEAQHIGLAVEGVQGRILAAHGGWAVDYHLPRQDLPEDVHRPGAYELPDGAVALNFEGGGHSLPFTLEAANVRRLEWHNATVSCSPAVDCPDGGGTARVASQANAFAALASYTELRFPDGLVSGRGSAWTIVAGGQAIDADLAAWSRFPNAMLAGDCGGSSCSDPAGRTFQATGNVSLAGLHQLSPIRLRTGYASDLDSARFDEEPIPSLVRTSVVVGAAVVGLGALAALVGLFARMRPALAHPRAKELNDIIHANPGLSFSEIRRHTGWGGGTIDHHMKRLLGAGLVVAEGYRNTVRYFENHGRYAKDWKEFAVLGDPDLRRLHQWLLGNPGKLQGALLVTALEWGWSRTATQRRLKALDEAGLLRAKRTGRTVAYTAKLPSRGSLIGRLLGTTGGKSA